MVDKSSIKNKDFSLELPLIIAKLKVVENGLYAESEKDSADNMAIFAVCKILGGCIKDLETINKAAS